MRLNERHAAIAVLFLVVILLVGFFWQDDSADPAPAGADQQLARQVETARVPGQVQASERTPRRGRRNSAPLGGLDEAPAPIKPAKTRGLQADAHRVEPGPSARPSSSAGSPAAPGSFERRPSAGSLDRLPVGPVRGGSAAPSGMDELERIAAKAEDQPRRASSAVNRRGFLVQRGPALDQVKTAASTREERVAASRAQAKPAAAPAPASREYTVRSGDSLSLIAQKECGSTRSMDEICRLNGLSDPDMIRGGMVLKLPAKTSSTPARVASKAPVAAGGRKTVTIRSGETLSVVLDRELGTYKRSIAAVKRLNPDLDPDRVAVGQSIVLPLPDEVPPAPAGVARPRATASQGPRVASSSNRADRSKFVVR